jgi:toxin FitB
MAARRRRGRSGDLRDTMTAGIVISTGATLATRNVSHFDDLSTSVINPW